MQQKINKPLLTLITIGLIIGIGNPWFDYPMAFSVGDEFESQKVAIQIMAEKSLRQYSTYLPLWSWIQIPFIALVIGFQFLLGEFKSIGQLQSTFILQAPGMYLWVARILSAMISALGIVWVYGIGKELKNRALGLIMAGLYMLDFMRIQTAHFGRYTSLYWFWCLGFGYFLTKLIKYKEKRYLILSFASATLATLSFQMGVLLFLVLGISFVLWIKQWRWAKDRVVVIPIILNLIILILIYNLNPTIIKQTLSLTKSGEYSETLLSNYSYLEKVWFYLKTLIFYQNIVLLMGIFGFFILVKRKKNQIYFPLILFSIIPALPYIIKNTTEPRYLLSLTLLGVLTAGIFLENYISKRKFWFEILLLSLVLCMAILGIRYNYLTFIPSTFIQAKIYLEQNVDAKQKLLINGNNYYLIPSLLSQQPSEIYDLDYYHKINKELIKISDEKQREYANIKNVRPANNLTYLSGGKDYQYLFQAKDYEWIVLDYYSQSEKDKLKKWFAMEENWQPTISFNPRNDGKEVDTTLNIKNPWNLFKLERFGPYIEIYQNLEN